jgi:hypothetical protein
MRPLAALLIPSLFLFAWKANGQVLSSDPPSDEPTGSESQHPAEDDESVSEPPQIPLAQDTLKGRFAWSLLGGPFAPLGSLEKDIPWRQAAKLGPGAELEAAIGVSRSVVLGAWLHASRLGSGDSCEACSTTNLAGGPLIRVHLVQGLKLDPWVSMGIGLRSIAISSDTDVNYTGFDWLRITVGADWYASRNVAVGPYVQLLGGVTVDRPESPPTGERPFDDRGSAYWTLSSGLRLTLSLPGR